MRKLVLFAHVFLDGFAADPNGGLDFLSYNQELQQFADELVKTVGAPVYGKNISVNGWVLAHSFGRSNCKQTVT